MTLVNWLIVQSVLQSLNTNYLILKNGLQVFFFPLFVSNLWPIDFSSFLKNILSLPWSRSSSGFPLHLKPSFSLTSLVLRAQSLPTLQCHLTSGFPFLNVLELHWPYLSALNKPNFFLLWYVLLFVPPHCLGLSLKNHFLRVASLNILSKRSLPFCPLPYSPSMFIS